MNTRYYQKFAVAVIIGNLRRSGKENLIPQEILNSYKTGLTSQQAQTLFSIASENNVKLYYFKRSDRPLPRVHKTLSFLKGIYFESLIDIGSGRGAFLLPFLEEFSNVSVTAVDILNKRVEMLTDISNGGVDNLTVVNHDIQTAPLNMQADVVTLLEVLEHIPDVKTAIRNAVLMAKKYVIVTVPSKEDDNPEHLRLLTKEVLTNYFNMAGVTKLTFDGVNGHLFLIAKVQNEL